MMLRNYKFSGLAMILGLLLLPAFDVMGTCSPSPKVQAYQVDTVVYFSLTAGRNDALVQWDFGDGQTGQGKGSPLSITHRYLQNGKYHVTMYYSDTIYDCHDTATVDICFFRLDSTATFSRSGDTVFASIACLPHASYRWSFGDNTYGRGCSTWHTYAQGGFYSTSLVYVKDSVTGCDYYYPIQFTTLNFTKCGFTANFSYTPYIGQVRTDAYPLFDANTPTSGRETWRWGDGSEQSSGKITGGMFFHRYNDVQQDYTLCHILEDSATHCKDSVCQDIHIDSCNAVPKYTFKIKGKEMSFKNLSGNYSEWSIDGISVGAGDSFSYTFKTNGHHKLCQQVYGSQSCTRRSCQDTTVISCGKLATNKVALAIDIRDCRIVHFDNINTDFTSYRWDFGDDSTSDKSSPGHQFMKMGKHTVTLIGLDSFASQCNDTVTIPYNNQCRYCGLVDTLVLKYDSLKPSATVLNYTYNRNTRKPANKYFWDFGDGTTSTEPSPKHTYPTTVFGVVHVMYIATDTSINCSDTIRFDIFIPSTGSPFTLNIDSRNLSVMQVSQDNRHFSLHPNPFRSELVLKGNIEGITDVCLYNILGQDIPVTYKVNNDQCEITVKEGLPSGLYFIRVRTSEGITTMSLVRE